MAQQSSKTTEQQLSQIRSKAAQQQLVQQQFQQVQLDQTRYHPRSVSLEGTSSIKEEINDSTTPVVNYHIFTKIDPPCILAHYMEICLEKGIDPMVDPLNIPDDYPTIPLPPTSSPSPQFFSYLRTCVYFFYDVLAAFCLQFFLSTLLFHFDVYHLYSTLPFGMVLINEVVLFLIIYFVFFH